MKPAVKKISLGLTAFVLTSALYGVWYMNTRVYIDSSVWNGKNYDQADVTDWVSSGGKIVMRNDRPVAVVLRTPPVIDNDLTWKLIKTAFVRVKKILSPQQSAIDIENFDFKANTKYLQSNALSAGSLMHEFVTTYRSPTGQIIVLYPNIRANTNGFGKAGELENIGTCTWDVKCPDDFKHNSHFDFLLEPETY
jgi:hypothetical protein